MSASTMGDCLNTTTDNIFISCPIIELIKGGICVSEGKSELREGGRGKELGASKKVALHLTLGKRSFNSCAQCARKFV